jgi:hypothetical protein
MKNPDPKPETEPILEGSIIKFGDYPYGATGYDPETQTYSWDDAETGK